MKKKQPKKNITVEAKNKPDAYKQARLSLPANVINRLYFKFVDCVVLADEKLK